MYLIFHADEIVYTTNELCQAEFGREQDGYIKIYKFIESKVVQVDCLSDDEYTTSELKHLPR